jgi:hypothetical protein
MRASHEAQVAGPGCSAGSGKGLHGIPWLPLNPDRAMRNVAAMKAAPRSILILYQRLIALRRTHLALHTGSYVPVPVPSAGDNDVSAFERRACSWR